MTLPNDTAFGINEYRPNNPGLTKREYFAAMAVQGICANTSFIKTSKWFEATGEDAVKIADALIKALNK